MAFRLKADESPSKGVRRVVKAQLEKAIEAVALPFQNCAEERIHRARKCFKRVRATLKLARPGLAKHVYRQENERFRDLGRLLSPMRDVAALTDAFNALIDRFGDQGQPHEFDTVHQALDTRECAVTDLILHDENRLDRLGREIEEARSTLDDWASDQLDWDSLENGLRAIVKAGRESFKKAHDSHADADMHEWRKRTKDLAYALEVLDFRRNRVAQTIHEQTVALGNCLGLDRDLKMLRSLVTTSVEPAMQASATVIVPLIDARRGNLQREAFEIGGRVILQRARELSAALIAVSRHS